MHHASKRHRLAFLAPVALGAGVLAMSGAALVHFVTATDIAGFGKALGRNCAGVFAIFSRGLEPPHLLATLLISAAGTAFLVSLWRQVKATRRYLRTLHAADEAETSLALEQILERLGLTRDRVRVIAAEAPMCFSAGFIRPSIYVSTGTLNLLNRQELTAVMAHERYHLAKKDPARSAILRALSRSLFFLPIMKSLEARHAIAKEVAADAEALRHAGGKLALAGALYKLSATHSTGMAGLAFFAERSHLAVRISAIEGKRLRLAPFTVSRIASTFLVFAALFAILVPRANAESPPQDCQRAREEAARPAVTDAFTDRPVLEYAPSPATTDRSPTKPLNHERANMTATYARP